MVKKAVTPIDTKREVAKIAGVSHDTIHKVKTKTVVKIGFADTEMTLEDRLEHYLLSL